MPSMHSQRIKQELKPAYADVEQVELHGTKRLRDYSYQQPASKRPKLEEKFVCPAKGCGASYTRRHNLKTHFKTCHQDVEHMFPEVFQTLKSTKEGKEFKCPVDSCICGYSRKGDLKFHFMRKHPDLLPRYPDICKSKSSKSNKKYVCPVTECKCGYMRKSDLRSHFQTKHPELVDQFPEYAPSHHEGTDDTESYDESTLTLSPDREQPPFVRTHRVKKEQELRPNQELEEPDALVAAACLSSLRRDETEEIEAAEALQALALKSPSREPARFITSPLNTLPPLRQSFSSSCSSTLHKNSVKFFCAPNPNKSMA